MVTGELGWTSTVLDSGFAANKKAKPHKQQKPLKDQVVGQGGRADGLKTHS